MKLNNCWETLIITSIEQLKNHQRNGETPKMIFVSPEMKKLIEDKLVQGFIDHESLWGIQVIETVLCYKNMALAVGDNGTITEVFIATFEDEDYLIDDWYRTINDAYNEIAKSDGGVKAFILSMSNYNRLTNEARKIQPELLDLETFFNAKMWNGPRCEDIIIIGNKDTVKVVQILKGKNNF